MIHVNKDHKIYVTSEPEHWNLRIFDLKKSWAKFLIFGLLSMMSRGARMPYEMMSDPDEPYGLKPSAKFH